MLDVGTHELHAAVAGEGLPVVVIDGGLGARAEEYGGLQRAIAVETAVVTYDRAGYGLSEAGPLSRDSGREAEELRALLRGLGLPGPYVLVGHSLGGLIAEVFAGRYPEDVAALVLLDPPPLAWLLGERFADLRGMAEEMTSEWQAAADRGLEAADAQVRRNAEFLSMIASEHREMLGRSALLAAEAGSFGEMPLVVIASGVPNPLFGAAAEDYQAYWIEQSRAVSARSARVRLVLAEDSTHRLHEDAADLVVQAILSVVAEVRAQQ